MEPGSPARRVVAHIGLNKSGSTTIQTWLAENQEALAAQGIVHDTLHGEGALDQMHGFYGTAIAQLGDWRLDAEQSARFGIKDQVDAQARVADFVRRADESFARTPPGGTYVISSEYLAARLVTAERIGALHRWLSDRFDEVRYVLYLRDQVEWVPSAYTQMVRTGGTASLDGFIERRGRYDYHALVRRWARTVGTGRVIVRLLERDSLVRGDLIDDMAAILGADADLTTRPGRANEGLPARQVRALLFANRLGDALDRLGLGRARPTLLRLTQAVGGRGKFRLSPAQAAHVAGLNAASNERLRLRLFPDRPTLFRGARPGAAPLAPPTSRGQTQTRHLTKA